MNENATVSGRPMFAIVSVVVILIAGLLGAVVGTTGQARAMSMDLFGVVSFPMSPVSMAAFGMLATAGVLAVLFGLVNVAAQYDTEADS